MSIFNRWFGTGANPHERETKTTSFPMIAFQSNSVANWGASDFRALSIDGFMRNPVVYRCVRLISEAAAAMPWVLFSSDAEMDDHPLLDLLGQPNFRQSGQEFMEALFAHLAISGNAFVKQVSIGNAPRELHLLSPDKVKISTDPDGWPIGYEYTNGNHKQKFGFADDNSCPVLHLRMFNPLDDMTGMSPLRAAHMALNIHNAAATWNKALLDNSARPSGALVYTSGETPNLSDEQFERLKHELEEGYSGASRAGRPMLLEGGLDWKAMGFSPRDMDFMEAKNGAARDIALAFGVPPMLLGIPGDNTYANYVEANKAFWRLTVSPLVDRTTQTLGNWLTPQFESGLRLDVDRDKVDALSSDRSALWQRLQATDFLSQDEKRSVVGYGPLNSENS